jgi:hypothetical protein
VPCGHLKFRSRFRSNISLSVFSVREYAKGEHNVACSKLLAFCWMLGVLFDPKNGDIAFSRNVGKLLSDFRSSCPKINCSSNEPGYLSRYSDWLRAGRPRGRSLSPGRGNIFSSPRRPYRFWGPTSLIFNGCQGIFLWGVKRTGRESDHLPPTNAEVKNTWIYTSIPPYVFMA